MMIDFEGRSTGLGFILDSIDMVMNLFFVVLGITRVILEINSKERLTKATIADALISLTCLGGIVSEGIIATDFREFLAAETAAVGILRTLKCFKLFLLFSERKGYWKKLHDLLMILIRTILSTLPTFCLWLIAILAFALMGHHIEGGRILVD